MVLVVVEFGMVLQSSWIWDGFWLADRVGHMAEGLWLADGVWHKMCDRQTDRLTELQKAVNAWVAFATKNKQKLRYFLSVIDKKKKI